MKRLFRVITIIFLLFIVSICVSSCKTEIEELEIQGLYMSEERIKEYLQPYEEYKVAIEEGKKRKIASSGWYNLSSKQESKIVSDGNSITTNTYINGEIYDSFSFIDKKAKIDIDVELSVIEKQENSHLQYSSNAKISIILIEGLLWIKGKMDFDIDGKNSVKSKIYKKYYCDEYNSLTYTMNDDVDLSQILEILEGIMEQFLNFKNGSIIESISKNFLDNLGSVSKDTSIYETEKGIMTETTNNDENSYSVEKASYEFEKDSYLFKNIELYSSINYKNVDKNSILEQKSYSKIRKKLMGIINEPINKSKYGW